MPYSFTKIEKDKTNTISLVFAMLIVMYFMTAWLIALISTNYIAAEAARNSGNYQFIFISWYHTFYILVGALIVGALHWVSSTHNIINKILRTLQAEKLDLSDKYHKRFRNIIDEVSVATGGTKIEGVIINTSALNAFAVADFKGRAVIGSYRRPFGKSISRSTGGDCWP